MSLTSRMTHLSLMKGSKLSVNDSGVTFSLSRVTSHHRVSLGEIGWGVKGTEYAPFVLSSGGGEFFVKAGDSVSKPKKSSIRVIVRNVLFMIKGVFDRESFLLCL